MSIKQRAITDEQKAERRQIIIKSAQRLFQETSYNSLSMAQIAAGAGIAKGTIFLYFETKEELFLALSWQEYQKCFKEMNTGLSKYLSSSISCSVEEFLQILRSAFTENQVLLRLIAINSVMLEQNINYATALEFKLMLAEQVKHTGNLFERVLPFLRQSEGEMVLLQLQVLATGIQHLSEPAPIIKQVISDERLGMFRVNFDNFFCVTIRAVLEGLKARGG
jgi:AcrR family transcriptional regulator